MYLCVYGVERLSVGRELVDRVKRGMERLMYVESEIDAEARSPVGRAKRGIQRLM